MQTALDESGLQVVNYLIILREKRAVLCTDLDRKERFLQENRMKSLQDIEE